MPAHGHRDGRQQQQHPPRSTGPCRRARRQRHSTGRRAGVRGRDSCSPNTSREVRQQCEGPRDYNDAEHHSDETQRVGGLGVNQKAHHRSVIVPTSDRRELSDSVIALLPTPLGTGPSWPVFREDPHQGGGRVWVRIDDGNADDALSRLGDLADDPSGELWSDARVVDHGTPHQYPAIPPADATLARLHGPHPVSPSAILT